MIRATSRWAWLLTLALQNLAIYWQHYFTGAGIPWDFSMSYFGMVAFWTSLIRQGVFPQWVPYQQMGYPFALQVQSGLNYLPLWIFPALDIRYTLHAAVVFQCLHVLLGACGMFVLARTVRASAIEALVAAVAFQFFGGFYSNAEHADIVRAFAWTPWLLYVYTLPRPLTSSLPRRAWLIPPVLFLFLTGAYPGNVIGAALIIGLFVVLQFLEAIRAGGWKIPSLRVGAAGVLGLTGLGAGMAAIHLGPLLLFQGDYVRTDATLGLDHFGLGLSHLPGLFLSNASLPGEISMTSTYVTLPMLMLVCFAPVRAFARHWPLVAVTGVAALLAAGDHTPLLPALQKALPVTGLSRFPSSDYRAFVAVGLLLLSLSGLRAVATGSVTRRRMVLTGVACLGWATGGTWLTYGAQAREIALTVALVAIVFVVLVYLRGRSRMLSAGAAVVLLAVVALDAVRIIPAIQGWKVPDMEAYYPVQGSPPYTRNRGRRLAPSYLIINAPETRPARQHVAGLSRWSGYITGQYYTTDLTPNVLRGTPVIFGNDRFLRYMMKEWSPLLLPPDAATTARLPSAVTDSALDAALADSNARSADSVRQTRYRVNDVTYDVDLAEPQLLVENEMYFPGWRARLTSPDAADIEAVAVNRLFRGWLLPAGHYTMVATFSFPYLTALRGLSGGCALAWLIACVMFLPRSARTAGVAC